LAVGASLVVSGCSQGSGAVGAIDVDPKAIEAHVTKLAGETLKGTATTAANLDAIKAMMPEEVQLTWGNLTFDAATNSTLVTDLKVVPRDMPTVGVQISELRLWDFDADLLKARFSGQRLSETVQLARRIDAKGVSLFGLAEAVNQMQDMQGGGMLDEPMDPDSLANPTKFQPADPTLPETPEDWPPTTDPEFTFEPDAFGPMAMTHIDRYDVSIGRIIIDDVMLRPFVTPPPPPAGADPYDQMSMFMPMLQNLAAISTSYGIDTAAYFDFKVGIEMTEMGQKMSGDILIRALGARGMRGGDLDGMFMRDMTYAAKADVGADTPIDMNYTLGLMTLEDLRLEKLMGFLVKAQVPPRTESDLMGLGLWRTEAESFKIAGKEIYSVAEGMADLKGWHWFIPTNLQGSAKKVTLDLGAIMDLGLQFSQMSGAQGFDEFGEADEFAVDQTAEIQQAKAMLEKYGLSRLTFDSSAGWNWNAGNGDTKLNLAVAGADLFDVDAKYEGVFPTFKAVSDVIPEDPEQTNPMAIASVFQTGSALKLIDLNVKDNGGLTKVFSIMGDFAPEMGIGPDTMSGDQVRGMVAGMVRQLADPQATGMPEVAALMAPVASFLEAGGKLRVAVQPSKPMPFASLAGTVMAAGMGSPAQAIKDLGIKVEHSK
jgi:hypothetical protein